MLWVKLLTLLLLLLFLCPIPSLSFTLTTTSSSSSHSHTRFIYAGCSQDKYSPNSPFQSNVLSFLSSLSSSSSQLSYNAFALANTTGSGDSLFGLYQCRGDLRLHDCSHCISTASNQISLLCPSAFWASLQLEGCYVRYDRFDFLGKPDDSVKFRKCGRSAAADDDLLRRRDDVLAEVQGASGFRVSTSGLVEGVGQCLGDLGPQDCSACLVDAVSKLRSLCAASSAAGDLFLGQCYARYWTSGYYDQPDSSNEDQVGKSVAIIVGVLAGLAILIILLSICRKSMG